MGVRLWSCAAFIASTRGLPLNTQDEDRGACIEGQLSFSFFFLTEILFFEFLMSSGCKADMYHVKQKALAPQPRGLRFLQHKVTSAFSASTDFQVKRSKKLPAPHPAMELTQPLQRWLPECGSLWKCVFTRRGHGCLSFLYPRPQPSFSSLLPSRLLFFLCQPVPDTVPGAED